MSISLTFTAVDVPDLHQQMQEFLAGRAGLVFKQDPAISVQQTGPAVDQIEAEPPKTRGRPKKEKAQAQVAENSASAPAAVTPAAEDAAVVETAVVPAAVSAPSSEPVQMTFDQFKAKLQELHAANNDNLKRVIKALNNYGVQSVKAAKPEHYAEIVVRAEQYIADQVTV